jgi:GNAT superfamily N-acetyltransferase
MEHRIVGFDPGTAPEDQVERYLDLEDRLIRELENEDPSPLREHRRDTLGETHPQKQVYRWVAEAEFDGRQVVTARGEITFVTENDTGCRDHGQHAMIDLGVDRRFRRQGLGTELLGVLVHRAVAGGRVRAIEACRFQESGWRFCAKHGGKLALEAAQNRLSLAEVDWGMMAEWRDGGAERNRARGTQLLSFQVVPEEMLEDLMGLYNEIVDAVPLGGLEMRVRVTPESRRMDEARTGRGWYTLVSREADGTLSGLTEVVHEWATPYRVEQELTGVRNEHRGRGLGKWLKAEMLFFIRDRLPEVMHVDTGNADTNAPMISINRRMGFKRHQTERCYRFELEALWTRLSALPETSKLWQAA